MWGWREASLSTHHEDEGPQALSQRLAKQPVADVEHLPAAGHQLLLSTHGWGRRWCWRAGGRRTQQQWPSAPSGALYRSRRHAPRPPATPPAEPGAGLGSGRPPRTARLGRLEGTLGWGNADKEGRGVWCEEPLGLVLARGGGVWGLRPDCGIVESESRWWGVGTCRTGAQGGKRSRQRDLLGPLAVSLAAILTTVEGRGDMSERKGTLLNALWCPKWEGNPRGRG